MNKNDFLSQFKVTETDRDTWEELNAMVQNREEGRKDIEVLIDEIPEKDVRRIFKLVAGAIGFKGRFPGELFNEDEMARKICAHILAGMYLGRYLWDYFNDKEIDVLHLSMEDEAKQIDDAIDALDDSKLREALRHISIRFSMHPRFLSRKRVEYIEKIADEVPELVGAISRATDRSEKMLKALKAMMVRGK